MADQEFFWSAILHKKYPNEIHPLPPPSQNKKLKRKNSLGTLAGEVAVVKLEMKDNEGAVARTVVAIKIGVTYSQATLKLNYRDESVELILVTNSKPVYLIGTRQDSYSRVVDAII